MSINGTATFTYYPAIPVNQRGNGVFNRTSYQFLKPVNMPHVFQVAVQNGTNDLSYVPQFAGDVVNVLFDVYVGANNGGQYQSITDNPPVATLRKAVDIPRDVFSNYLNVYIAGTSSPEVGPLSNMRTWTVDIHQILKPYLTYGLVPCGRGSFNQVFAQGHLGGGLGGKYGDRILSPLTGGNISVYVKARFEVLDSSGNIEIAQAGSGGDYTIDLKDLFWGGSGYGYNVINAVCQSDEQQDINNYVLRANIPESRGRFLSRCPNGDLSSDKSAPRFYKEVRLDDYTEILYFFVKSIKASTTYTTFAGSHSFQTRAYQMRFRVEGWTAAGFSTGIKFLNASTDFAYSSLGWWQGGIGPGQTLGCSPYPSAWLTQNVSPGYIAGSAGAGSILWNSTDYYRVRAEWMDNESGSCDTAGVPAGPTGTDCENTPGSWNGDIYAMSEYRYFKIDKESQNEAFPFVRVHWLNSLGGIDSYTFKRDKTESISRSISTFERKPNDPQWVLQTYNDTVTGQMLDWTLGAAQWSWDLQVGSDQYKTETEVLDVTSIRGGTVYSTPLEKPRAEWLSEILKSPNVWIEEINDRGIFNAEANEMVYNQTQYEGIEGMDYVPIIVEEGDMVTANEAERTVMMQLKYRHGVSEKTQSN